MTNISKHITLQEATESATALRMGIKNVPNELELEAMKYVAENLFEPIREWYDKPIKINSFFYKRRMSLKRGSVRAPRFRNS